MEYWNVFFYHKINNYCDGNIDILHGRWWKKLSMGCHEVRWKSMEYWNKTDGIQFPLKCGIWMGKKHQKNRMDCFPWSMMEFHGVMEQKKCEVRFFWPNNLFSMDLCCLSFLLSIFILLLFISYRICGIIFYYHDYIKNNILRDLFYQENSTFNTYSCFTVSFNLLYAVFQKICHH